MTYNQFRSAFADFTVISLDDIRAVEPGFDRRRLSEWQAKGYLLKIVKGRYVFAEMPLDERRLFEIAARIYRPSYVSLESALSHHGLIPENVYAVTAVSTRRTYRFDTPVGLFSYRTVKPGFFYGYGIGPGQARVALPEKAVLDLLYLDPGLTGPDDFASRRLNRAVFIERCDGETFTRLAARSGVRALNDRAGRFLEWVRHA